MKNPRCFLIVMTTLIFVSLACGTNKVGIVSPIPEEDSVFVAEAQEPEPQGIAHTSRWIQSYPGQGISSLCRNTACTMISSCSHLLGRGNLEFLAAPPKANPKFAFSGVLRVLMRMYTYGGCIPVEWLITINANCSSTVSGVVATSKISPMAGLA